MIESSHIKSLIKKENLFKDYILQANLIYQVNGDKHTEEECVILQRAADLQSEMAQITTGYERETHRMKVAELNEKIAVIYKQIDPEKYESIKNEYFSKIKKENQKNENKNENIADAKKKKENDLDATVRTWFKEPPKHSFADVSGMKSLKLKMAGCLNDMKREKLAKYLKIKPLTSYFFVGPPGCGKTYIIEAFAHELMNKEFKYIYLTGSDIISRYVGDAEKIVTRLFNEAADKAPCIVFIDEIDSVCKNRSLSALPEYAANITTSFLTGYNYINNTDKKIIFIGATNYPKRVDLAMLDRVEVIRVELPDYEARRSAFERHFNGMFVFEDGLTVDYMSQISDGYNYRDIDKVVETTKKLVFDELSALSNDDDALISAMESGKYKLTKEKFDLAFKSFKPVDKSEIINDINEWEKDIKSELFEGTVNVRTLDDTNEDTDIKKELVFKKEVLPEVWPLNNECMVDPADGFVTIAFSVKDKALKRLTAVVNGYNFICTENGEYFVLRLQPPANQNTLNITIMSENGFVGEMQIIVKRPVSANQNFDI